MDAVKTETAFGFKITVSREYSKRGMESTLLLKTLELSKSFNSVKRMATSVNKDEQAMIEALKRYDFIYQDEDEKNIYFEKKLKVTKS